MHALDGANMDEEPYSSHRGYCPFPRIGAIVECVIS